MFARRRHCVFLFGLCTVFWLFAIYYVLPNNHHISESVPVPLSSQDQAAVLKKVIRLDQEILGQKELQRQLTVRLEDLKKTRENSRENLLLLKKLLDQYELQTAGAEDGLQQVDSSVELQTKVVALNPDRNANPVIPVLVIACNRPSVQRCLDRLIKARLSSDQFPIIVSQDCGNEPTAEIIRSYETQIISIQQPDLSEPEVPDNHKRLVGYYKLSRHYSWALNQVFDKYNSSAVIIVEDDLEVGEDFYSYFQATLPILEADPSLWCVSAWNDNGKESLIDSSSPDLLHRSDFFPGLGWMMTRKLWETELKNKWPKAFWDDWMRNPEQRKERTCIRPEISRTRTFGKVGVSNGLFFDRHLKYIKLNDVTVPFMEKNLTYLFKDVYDASLLKEVYSLPIVQANDLKANSVAYEGPVRIQYHTKDVFKKITKVFGLMDDFKSGVPRTAYRGIVSFFWQGRRVYIAPNVNWKGYDLTWS